MDQQPYGQMIGSRNLTWNGHHRFRKQMGRLIRSFPGQPCEQMALHIQLIADAGLPFESSLIICHGDFHRLVVIQTRGGIGSPQASAGHGGCRQGLSRH